MTFCFACLIFNFFIEFFLLVLFSGLFKEEIKWVKMSEPKDSIDEENCENFRKTRFQKPKMKIYENFRNVYKRTQANCEAIRQFVSNDPQSSENNNNLPSPMSANCNSLGTTVLSDGNSTDDSGIDSSWSNYVEQNVRDSVDQDQTVNFTQVKKAIQSLEKRSTNLSKKPSTSRKTNKGFEARNLAELGKLLADTDQILSRNSNLRASLSISTQRPSNKANLVTAAITIPTPKSGRKSAGNLKLSAASGTAGQTPKVVRKVKFCENVQKSSSSSSASSTLERKHNLRKNLHNSSKTEKSPFVRHVATKTSTPKKDDSVPMRGSIKLAPKTVANLASKFDNLQKPVFTATHTVKKKTSFTASNHLKSHQQQLKRSNSKKSQNSAELKLAKGDINKIISALNKLEEDAAKDTAVLRRSLRLKAVKRVTETATKTTEEEEENGNSRSVTSSADRAEKCRQDEDEKPEIQDTNSLTTKYLATLASLAKKSKNDENTTLSKLLNETQKSPKKVSKNEQQKSSPAKFLDSLKKKQSAIKKPENSSLNGDFNASSETYEKIGSQASTCGYDDIGQNSHKYLDLYNSNSCFYDDIKSPSVHTYLSVNNAEIEETEKQSFVVTAKPAIVMEDQVDSLTYVYDDVNTQEDDDLQRLREKRASQLRAGGGGGGLYESIAGSLLNLAMTKEEEQQQQADLDDLYSTCSKKSGSTAAISGVNFSLDPSEALSYSLTKLSEVCICISGDLIYLCSEHLRA
jgi:hypothetical protein